MTTQGILPLHSVPAPLRAHGLCDAHVRPLVGVRLPDDTIRSWRTSPGRAWKHPLVEWARTGNSFAALAFDVDDHVALERLACANMGAAEVPVPNVAIYRRATGHAHAVYALARPVHRGEGARPRPLETLGRVSEWLREALQADTGYAGVLVANPISADYETAWLRVAAYPLAELTECIPRGWRRPAKPTTDAGRNCYIFHAALSWVSRPANWYIDVDAIVAYARVLNGEFPYGLPDREVLGIARSVARIHARHMASGQAERFAAIQASRGRKNTRDGQRRKGLASGQARYWRSGCAARERPWEAEGVSRRTWYRHRAFARSVDGQMALEQRKQDSPAQPALILIPQETMSMSVKRDEVLARVVAEITDALNDHPLALPAALSVYVEGFDVDPEEVTGEKLAARWDVAGCRTEWLALTRARVNEWAAECTVEETDCATGTVTVRPMEKVAA